VLGISWYSEPLQDVCVPLDRLIEQAHPNWLFRRLMSVGFVRGLFAFWVARSYDIIVTTLTGTAGCGLTLSFLEACLGGNRKRVVVLEFFRGPGPRGRLKRAAYVIRHWLIVKPTIRRAVRAIHVLTDWERQHYSNLFGVDVNRFTYIPFPQRELKDELPLKSTNGTFRVVSSGRYACDWETLFKAAEGRDWALTVVCSPADLPRVQRLNSTGKARILHDLSDEAYHATIRSASVYVLCLKELEVSSGHMRVRDAIRAGSPIVATMTKGLEGYLTHDETALLVEPGNYLAVREAVEYLREHPERQTQLAERAFNDARERTMEDYLVQVRQFVLSQLSNHDDLGVNRS
jgi:glycosyltransferase involved in cell wall biosynthesis